MARQLQLTRPANHVLWHIDDINNNVIILDPGLKLASCASEDLGASSTRWTIEPRV